MFGNALVETQDAEELKIKAAAEAEKAKHAEKAAKDLKFDTALEKCLIQIVEQIDSKSMIVHGQKEGRHSIAVMIPHLKMHPLLLDLYKKFPEYSPDLDDKNVWTARRYKDISPMISVLKSIVKSRTAPDGEWSPILKEHNLKPTDVVVDSNIITSLGKNKGLGHNGPGISIILNRRALRNSTKPNGNYRFIYGNRWNPSTNPRISPKDASDATRIEARDYLFDEIKKSINSLRATFMEFAQDPNCPYKSIAVFQHFPTAGNWNATLGTLMEKFSFNGKYNDEHHILHLMNGPNRVRTLVSRNKQLNMSESDIIAFNWTAENIMKAYMKKYKVKSLLEIIQDHFPDTPDVRFFTYTSYVNDFTDRDYGYHVLAVGWERISDTVKTDVGIETDTDGFTEVVARKRGNKSTKQTDGPIFNHKLYDMYTPPMPQAVEDAIEAYKEREIEKRSNY